ncbi:glycosyltransferase family 4 protein [Oscillatoria sp. CS-180]|uniref:glycosyltransferase family 4 protein n=1 Tax=Oscillatoria sp. CS-180 TaxID=3021720 RepID=UPI00232BB7B9|nr:glycosyltransferase family 4 protein [Oscillatoria sp. CS-180]MDB9527387.1 glycosyltransferase family 4 protein [Oscillatoria sp. CS-180]
MSSNPSQKRLSVLVSAYACGPGRGSEPGVGWNVARELSRYHHVHVFTRSNNRAAIEQELSDRPNPNLHFTYFDPPGWAAWLPPAQLPHYYSWQIAAYFMARKLLAVQTFDIVHHVTYVRYSSPSFLSLLSIPFVWGPVGGGEQAPKAFSRSFGLRGKGYEFLRNLSHGAGEVDPFTRITAQRSVVARATTADTAHRLERIGAKYVEVSSAIGLPEEEIERLSEYTYPQPSPIRFITIARLLHWKGIHLGIQAFAQVAEKYPCEYRILGKGPERKALDALVDKLGMADRIEFLGERSRDETLQQLSDCHALLHPSLHDSGGFVCLEAMAAGRPVVCLDLGGSAVQVSPETGILVPAKEPKQAVDDLAQAMEQLITDSELRQRLGQAGKTRVQTHFSWKAKGAELSGKYYQYIDIHNLNRANR